MNVVQTALPGVLRIEPDVFEDARGWFVETYRVAAYAEAGVSDRFVQENLSVSHKNVLRGLHLQHPQGQAKLVYSTYGEVFDVCVDVRVGSPTFGKWHSELLSAKNGRQLLIPVGFAHGFCVLSDLAAVAYKCSDVYAPPSQLTLAWNDSDLGIDWPITEPILSEKDVAGVSLAALHSCLPRFEGE